MGGGQLMMMMTMSMMTFYDDDDDANGATRLSLHNGRALEVISAKSAQLWAFRNGTFNGMK